MEMKIIWILVMSIRITKIYTKLLKINKKSKQINKARFLKNSYYFKKKIKNKELIFRVKKFRKFATPKLIQQKILEIRQ